MFLRRDDGSFLIIPDEGETEIEVRDKIIERQARALDIMKNVSSLYRNGGEKGICILEGIEVGFMYLGFTYREKGGEDTEEYATMILDEVKKMEKVVKKEKTGFERIISLHYLLGMLVVFKGMGYDDGNYCDKFIKKYNL